nr:TylF/MycF family methyltransferase [Lachnospiraceae bacterium]
SFDIENDNYDQIKKWEGCKADTSEDIVLRKIPYPDNAIFKKGYVPETLQDINDTFAFVNLDMDLYMPTYEALKFFWEKMSPGGYIFIHDVNNWDGCGKAVEDFCKKYHTGYICLNDRITAALVKPFEINEDRSR